VHLLVIFTLYSLRLGKNIEMRHNRYRKCLIYRCTASERIHMAKGQNKRREVRKPKKVKTDV